MQRCAEFLVAASRPSNPTVVEGEALEDMSRKIRLALEQPLVQLLSCKLVRQKKKGDFAEADPDREVVAGSAMPFDTSRLPCPRSNVVEALIQRYLHISSCVFSLLPLHVVALHSS